MNKLVDFAGWQMPIYYTSQIQGHHHVRQNSAMFNVSHMSVLDITGPRAVDFIRYILAKHIAKLQELGRALYSCILNSQSGVIDDLIVCYVQPQHYRIVLNAGRREHDMSWLTAQAIGEITNSSFSPTLGHTIGLAKINTDKTDGIYIDRHGEKWQLIWWRHRLCA